MYLPEESKRVLDELQKLQYIYLGSIDMTIETRRDMKTTCVHFCTYLYDNVNKEFHKTSKLYVHKIPWSISDYDLSVELTQIKIELANIYSKINENNKGYLV